MRLETRSGIVKETVMSSQRWFFVPALCLALVACASQPPTSGDGHSASGEITMVHAYPGQAVQAGDPVVTIAQDSGRYIVSYIRADQRIRVEPNMEVRVREKRSGARPVRASIVKVGPQMELVPLQHLRDPTQPEWGVPITIELPPELDVRPGELIDIIFSSRMAQNN